MPEIKFLSNLADLTGEKSLTIEYDGLISGLIDNLDNKLEGKDFKTTITGDEGEIKDFVKILINGNDIRGTGGLSSPVKDDDEIVIFQTLAGG
ncbi:MoaD/ThiS family protein [Methanobacterium sp.]|uniref:MoaD/ThiS family protein n=1 Tax=Methanobacterium sp. TaxID=2164 RepID=UPI0025FB6757|nr:MoaD/ThiS family protein [Methanobacterium sp.]MBI5460374.1 MoaD/ThiS family protein [Methanobacterium sp.]